MNKFVEDFGYMPLVASQHRLDPTLYWGFWAKNDLFGGPIERSIPIANIHNPFPIATTWPPGVRNTNP